MKQILFSIIILSALATTRSFATTPPLITEVQDQTTEHQNRRKEFMKQRNAFFILELDLTQKEATDFLPLYNELDSKRYDLWKDIRRKRAILERKAELSEQDMEMIIDKSLDNKVAEARLEREYYHKFKRVLPMEKVMSLRLAERKFARLFLNSSYD